MKFTDPNTGAEALIDGRSVKDASGESVSPSTTRAVYVDKEGVVWHIDVERDFGQADTWSGVATDVASVYFKEPRGLEPTLRTYGAPSMLEAIQAVDDVGLKWRSAKRHEDKATEARNWGWLLVLGIALLASKKGKR